MGKMAVSLRMILPTIYIPWYSVSTAWMVVVCVDVLLKLYMPHNKWIR